MKMISKLSPCAAIVASVFFVSPSFAADSEGTYSIRGIGALECQSFVDAAEIGEEQAEGYVRWLEGYFTGMNFHMEETYDISPFVATSDVAVLVLNQCNQEPDESIEAVTARIADALYNDREQIRSETSNIEYKGNSVNIRQNTLRRIQERLSAGGYYSEEPDGLYGPDTRAALISYQRDNGIPETGIPDRATVLRIIATE